MSPNPPTLFFKPLTDALSQATLVDAGKPRFESIVVAQPSAREFRKSQMPLPAHFKVSPYKNRGGRRSVREASYAGSSHKIALWPQDAMLAASVPLLICVISGSADLRLGDYILHCGKGSFIIVPPGSPYPDGSRPHLEPQHQDNGWCDLLWLCGWSVVSGLQCWLCHSRGADHTHSERGEMGFVLDPRSAQYFHALVNEASALQDAGSDTDRMVCRSLLLATLGAVQREIAAGRCFHPDRQVIESQVKPTSQAAMGQAQAFMASHLSKPLTIDNVAHSVYMSRARFTRRFREETGKTFVQFLTGLRLAEAKRLLRDTEWSVRVISRMVGFSSASHLREIFHRYEKVSPLGFRRQSRGQE